jgi:protein-L-isoaspartate(D-aspartate) O-methyltransferase
VVTRVSQSQRNIQGIGMTSARTRDRLVDRLAQNGIKNSLVLERVRSVPRHLFVDEALGSRAYEDSALPIGHGQTISQPYIVALMSQALLDEAPGAGPLKKVLEVGTGCGYQTAVLSPLAGQLFTIERIRGLQQAARARLRELGCNNIRYRHGDGMQGWPGQAPFDGILVAAAPAEIPQKLLDQLSVGGRLIIPIGPPGRQNLMRIIRTDDGFDRQSLCAVSFVPLLEGTG